MWSIIDLAPPDEDIDEKQEALDIILTEYTLNEPEKEAIGYYRSICRISMYPNVMQ